MIANDAPMRLSKKLVKYFHSLNLNKQKGFFIEAGANNGLYQNNSLYLETSLKWKGLLIEPNPTRYEECKKNRPNSIVKNCALVSKNYNEDSIKGFFNETDYENSLMGQIRKNNSLFDNTRWKEKSEISIPAKTLTTILSKEKYHKLTSFR
jgi:hypothetical protein